MPMALSKEVSQEISDRDEWLKAEDVQEEVPRAALVETIRALVRS